MCEQITKVPAIRFKGFTDPWKQRKLGDVATEIVAGGDIVKKLILDDGRYPVIANALANDGIVGYYNSDYRIKAPAVTVTGRGDVGHAKVRDIDFTPVVRLLSIKSDHDVYFLENAINTLKIVVESTGVPQLTVPQLAKYEISFPTSPDEEEKIGSYYHNLDNLITLQQRELDLMKKQKQTLLSKMFPKTGEQFPKIRFKGFTDPWEQRKLGEVGTTFAGLSGKTASDFGHGEASFITYMNVFSNPVCNPNMVEHVEIDSKQREVEVGDVLFTTSSETPEEVGMSSVLKEKLGVTYLNSFCFGFRPSVKFDLDYLAFMLRSESVRRQIKLLAQGISRFNISRIKMMDIDIQVPSIDEQVAIGKYFDQLNHLITLQQRKLNQMKIIKKSLLKAMFV